VSRLKLAEFNIRYFHILTTCVVFAENLIPQLEQRVLKLEHSNDVTESQPVLGRFRARNL